MYEEEKEIDLKDMLACLLHRWRTIFVWMVLFAVLIGGVLSYKDYNELKNSKDTEGIGYRGLTAEMTEEQINNAEQFYKRYEDYKARVNEAQDYYNESPRMKINAMTVSKYEVEYYVETGYANIISSFQSSALDLDDFEQIAQILGEGNDPRYAGELVSLGGSVTQDSYDIDTDKVGDVIKGNVSQTYKGVLHVTVTSNDRTSGEQVAQVVENAVMDYCTRLNDAGIQVSISPLTTNYTEVIDTELADYQRAKTEEISSRINDFNALDQSAKETLDEKEYALYEYRVDKSLELIDHVHWLKWVVIGAAAGVCLGAMFVVLVYLFSPQIKTLYELKKIYKKQELGIVIQPTKSRVLLGKLFHTWAEKIEHSGITRVAADEETEILASRIAGIMKNGEQKELFLVSDIRDGYTKEILEKCVELLKDRGIKASYGDPVTSVKELDDLRSKDAAVMVSTIKKSLPSAIRAELTLCEENAIPVIGNFIVYPQA